MSRSYAPCDIDLSPFLRARISFRLYGEHSILDAHINVFGFHPWNIRRDFDFLVCLSDVHLRPETGCDFAARRQPGLAPEIVKHAIDLMSQIVERIRRALRRRAFLTSSPWNNCHNKLLSF